MGEKREGVCVGTKERAWLHKRDYRKKSKGDGGRGTIGVYIA